MPVAQPDEIEPVPVEPVPVEPVPVEPALFEPVAVEPGRVVPEGGVPPRAPVPPPIAEVDGPDVGMEPLWVWWTRCVTAF